MNNLRKPFTLIEILVVVAIIGILSSLLLPALGKARNKSRLAVCSSNYKNLYIAHVLYAEDNNDYFAPSGMLSGTYHAWDDKISEYVKSYRTDAQKGGAVVWKAWNISGLDVFKCPSDDVVKHQDSKAPRTYAMMAGTPVPGADPDYYGISWKIDSRSIGEIEDYSGSALMGEYVHSQNYCGSGSNVALLRKLSDQTSVNLELHGQLKYNYLFTDGHVENLFIYSTFGTGTEDAPLGMWSHLSGD